MCPIVYHKVTRFSILPFALQRYSLWLSFWRRSHQVVDATVAVANDVNLSVRVLTQRANVKVCVEQQSHLPFPGRFLPESLNIPRAEVAKKVYTGHLRIAGSPVDLTTGDGTALPVIIFGHRQHQPRGVAASFWLKAVASFYYTRSA
jgi:hypothetical protein